MSDERAEVTDINKAIIKAVEKFKCIYDKDDANYHNDDVKTRIFNKISEHINKKFHINPSCNFL